MRKAVIWQYFQPFMRKHPKVFERLGFFKKSQRTFGALRGRQRTPRMNRSFTPIATRTSSSYRGRYDDDGGSEKRRSRPVSRVLYALRRDSHSSRPGVTARLQQPTREQRGPRYRSPMRSCSRWGLPCHAALAPHAVRSYRTLSPLPRTSEDAVRRSALCCTGRQLALPRRYLAPCPMEPGLSSMRLRATRLSGRLRQPL